MVHYRRVRRSAASCCKSSNELTSARDEIKRKIAGAKGAARRQRFSSSPRSSRTEGWLSTVTWLLLRLDGNPL